MTAPDPEALEYSFTSGGVQVQYFIHGPQKMHILKFFHFYFEAFPARRTSPDVTVHYFTHDEATGFSKADHPYWNELLEDFVVEKKANSEIEIQQRDFIAIQKPNQVFYATGPTLSQGCCDSTDNLVQYVLGRHLVSNGILPLHAAAVVVGQEAWIFFGASGAGKSTLALTAFENNGYQIMAGDQIFLTETDGRVMALANTTTIFGFHRDHPAWSPGPFPVRGIFHLKATPRTYSFEPRNFKELLPIFLRETVSWKEVIDSADLLDIALKLGENKDVLWGEFTYQKSENFWPQLLKDVIK
jgi:hypothetical protein